MTKTRWEVKEPKLQSPKGVLPSLVKSLGKEPGVQALQNTTSVGAIQTLGGL